MVFSRVNPEVAATLKCASMLTTMKKVRRENRLSLGVTCDEVVLEEQFVDQDENEYVYEDMDEYGFLPDQSEINLSETIEAESVPNDHVSKFDYIFFIVVYLVFNMA